MNKLLKDLNLPVQVPDLKKPGTSPGPQEQTPESAVEPRQTPGQPGGYQPPLHGNNPHGQGDVIGADLAPSGVRPTGGNTATSPEDIIVGRARGEQGSNGQYHGHITIVSLFGNELLGVDTTPGQAKTGPLNALQTSVLNQLCTASQICLNVLRADSSTSATGSTNRFAVANATIGNPQTGLLSLTAAESNGNISQDANCQTTTGNSTVADANIFGGAVADVSQSSSTSRACNNGTAQQQNNTSSVIGLGGTNVPLPAPGCANGTPDTVTGIPVLAPIVCNANDSNGLGEAVTQAVAPYGVREALTVFVLDAGGAALLKVTTGGSESRAQAPATPSGPDRPGGPGDDDPRDPGDGPGDPDDGPGDPGDGPGGPGDGPGDRGDSPQCSDGIDNDGDGRTDLDDPHCDSPSDDSEAEGALAFTGGSALLVAILGLATLFLGLMTLRLVGVLSIPTTAGVASNPGSRLLRTPGAATLEAASARARQLLTRHRWPFTAFALLALAIVAALGLRAGSDDTPATSADATARVSAVTVDPAIGASVVAPAGWTAKHDKQALRLTSPDRTTLLAVSTPGPARDAHRVFESTLTQIRRDYRDVSVSALAGQKLAGRPTEAALVSAVNRRGDRVKILVGAAEGRRRAYLFQASMAEGAPAKRLVQAQTALNGLQLDVAP